jgi:hypothetical protein
VRDLQFHLGHRKLFGIHGSGRRWLKLRGFSKALAGACAGQPPVSLRASRALEHDPEKGATGFPKDHAQSKI